MMLRNVAYWALDYLCEVDLTYSNVRLALSSPHLQGLQECLRHKRYINNVTEIVRAVRPCCRPPDLYCSR